MKATLVVDYSDKDADDEYCVLVIQPMGGRLSADVFGDERKEMIDRVYKSAKKVRSWCIPDFGWLRDH